LGSCRTERQQRVRSDAIDTAGPSEIGRPHPGRSSSSLIAGDVVRIGRAGSQRTVAAILPVRFSGAVAAVVSELARVLLPHS